jgi:hypothetical protein
VVLHHRDVGALPIIDLAQRVLSTVQVSVLRVVFGVQVSVLRAEQMS